MGRHESQDDADDGKPAVLISDLEFCKGQNILTVDVVGRCDEFVGTTWSDGGQATKVGDASRYRLYDVGTIMDRTLTVGDDPYVIVETASTAVQAFSPPNSGTYETAAMAEYEGARSGGCCLGRWG